MTLRVGFLAALALFGLEIWSLAYIGAHLGALATLLLVICGMIVGWSLIKKSGANLSHLLRGRAMDTKALSAGTASGLAFGLAGLLFLMPGFASDAMALALLLPGPRRALARWIERHMVDLSSGSSGRGGPPQTPVIEGEAIEIHEPSP
jgi:UPF0716 protein FxsA